MRTSKETLGELVYATAYVTTFVEARDVAAAIRATIADLEADADNLCIVSVLAGSQPELNTATTVCSAEEWPGGEEEPHEKLAGD